MSVQVKLLSDKATMPTRGTMDAAGHDLYAAIATIVPAQGTAIIETHIAMKIPHGFYGRIAPRSSLAARCSIGVGAGVIDADYRGAIGVVLFNHGRADLVVNRGDRIAQIIITPCSMEELVQVPDLDVTVRAEGGFGSTGK